MRRPHSVVALLLLLLFGLFLAVPTEDVPRCLMLSKVIAVVLVAVLLHGNLIAQTEMQPQLQTPGKMREIVRKAQERDKAVRVILIKKIENQKKFSGKVSEISDTSFVVTDEKTGTTKTLAYADVREVHPKGLSRGEKIATGVAVAGVFILVTFIWGYLHPND